MPACLSPPSQDGDYLHTFRHAFDETFGWEVRRGLELAIFHTFAVPAISKILDQTGEFTHRGQKRYDDTVALLREIARDGPASPRGRAAIRRMNWIHRPYRIRNDDLLYVLATFIVIPVRWIGSYGWRELTAEEIRAAVRYYRTMGRLMGIRQMPETYPEFAGYLDAYERDHHSFTEANRRLAESLIAVIRSWAPRPVRPLARQWVAAALGSRLRRALGVPEPLALVSAGVHGALLARAAIMRLVPQLRHLRRSRRRLRSYPDGYALSELGPAWAAGKSPGGQLAP
jgi:mpaB/rubber oxygenase-like protein